MLKTWPRPIFEKMQEILDLCVITSIPLFLDLPWRSYKLTHVRSSVRPFVTSFSRDWLISFCWFLAQRCKMAMAKMWRSPIFGKKFFWANLVQKPPKNRVFWTLCKIASLVFSDFWQKDREQGTLKWDRNNFFRKILFRRSTVRSSVTNRKIESKVP